MKMFAMRWSAGTIQAKIVLCCQSHWIYSKRPWDYERKLHRRCQPMYFQISKAYTNSIFHNHNLRRTDSREKKALLNVVARICCCCCCFFFTPKCNNSFTPTLLNMVQLDMGQCQPNKLEWRKKNTQRILLLLFLVLSQKTHIEIEINVHQCVWVVRTERSQINANNKYPHRT